MKNYWNFSWNAYPWGIAILGLGIVLDLSGYGDTPTQDSLWFFPSLIVFLYWVATTLLIRFKIAKKPLSLVFTWLVMVPMWVVGFVGLAFLTNGNTESAGAPAILFFLCIKYGWQTLRMGFERSEEKQKEFSKIAQASILAVLLVVLVLAFIGLNT